MDVLAKILEDHIGLIAWFFIISYILVLYARGEAKGFFPFVREMLSGPDGRASTKNAALFIAATELAWGYDKVTLAVCRWIDKGSDPTTIYAGLTAVMASLAGVAYIWGKKIAAQGGDDPKGGQP